MRCLLLERAGEAESGMATPERESEIGSGGVEMDASVGVGGGGGEGGEREGGAWESSGRVEEPRLDAAEDDEERVEYAV